jgi:hypothetical protein
MSTSAFDLRGLAGLTEEEARTRLAREGANELPTQKQRGAFAIALEVVREPMFLMLVAAGSLYHLRLHPDPFPPRHAVAVRLVYFAQVSSLCLATIIWLGMVTILWLGYQVAGGPFPH